MNSTSRKVSRLTPVVTGCLLGTTTALAIGIGAPAFAENTVITVEVPDAQPTSVPSASGEPSAPGDNSTTPPSGPQNPSGSQPPNPSASGDGQQKPPAGNTGGGNSGNSGGNGTSNVTNSGGGGNTGVISLAGDTGGGSAFTGGTGDGGLGSGGAGDTTGLGGDTGGDAPNNPAAPVPASDTPAAAPAGNGAAAAACVPKEPVLPDVPDSEAREASVDKDTYLQGETITITADKFQPNEQVQLAMFYQPTLIGNFKSDKTGVVHAQVAVTKEMQTGTHTLQLSGWCGGTAVADVLIGTPGERVSQQGLAIIKPGWWWVLGAGGAAALGIFGWRWWGAARDEDEAEA